MEEVGWRGSTYPAAYSRITSSCHIQLTLAEPSALGHTQMQLHLHSCIWRGYELNTVQKQISSAAAWGGAAGARGGRQAARGGMFAAAAAEGAAPAAYMAGLGACLALQQPYCVICCHCPSAASFHSVTAVLASDTDSRLPLTDQLRRHTGAPKSCSKCRSQPPAATRCTSGGWWWVHRTPHQLGQMTGSSSSSNSSSATQRLQPAGPACCQPHEPQPRQLQTQRGWPACSPSCRSVQISTLPSCSALARSTRTYPPPYTTAACSPSCRSVQISTLPSCPALARVFMGSPKLGAHATSRTQSAQGQGGAGQEGRQRHVRPQNSTGKQTSLKHAKASWLCWLRAWPQTRFPPTRVAGERGAVLLPLPRLLVEHPNLRKGHVETAAAAGLEGLGPTPSSHGPTASACCTCRHWPCCACSCHCSPRLLSCIKVLRRLGAVAARPPGRQASTEPTTHAPAPHPPELLPAAP